MEGVQFVAVSHSQEGNRIQAAHCTGVLCAHLSDDQLTFVLRGTLLCTEGESDWSVLQARATALSAAMETAFGRLQTTGTEEAAMKAAVRYASSDRVSGGGGGCGASERR